MSLLSANLSSLRNVSQRFVMRAVATWLVSTQEAASASFHAQQALPKAARFAREQAVAPSMSLRLPRRAAGQPPRGLTHRVPPVRVQKARRGC